MENITRFFSAAILALLSSEVNQFDTNFVKSDSEDEDCQENIA